MLLERILFMGTPEFAVHIVDAVFRHFPELLSAVVTMPDAGRGRGKKETPSEVKQWAMKQHIPAETPQTKQEIIRLAEKYNPDLILVAAYGMILPKAVTDRYLCVNVHASLLPKYRGASPIQTALLRGDNRTGVTLFRMNEKMDEGDILLEREIPILETDNFGTLHDKLAALGAEASCDLIRIYQSESELIPVPQRHKNATYCKKIDKEDLKLPSEETPVQKLNRIRAFSPQPGAYTDHRGKRVKILAAELASGNRLLPTCVKPEGKNAMTYSDYLLAHDPLIL